ALGKPVSLGHLLRTGDVDRCVLRCRTGRADDRHLVLVADRCRRRVDHGLPRVLGHHRRGAAVASALELGAAPIRAAAAQRRAVMRSVLRKAVQPMVSPPAALAARRAASTQGRDSRRGSDEMVNDLLEHGAPVRDLRIDFFRGLALFMILVDHVTGDPISKITYQRFGFSDAAEIFVFLSGISCGIVYSRVLTRRGWTALGAAIARRSMLIYGYYVLSSIIIILLLLAASPSIRNSGVADQSFILLREDPISAVWSTIFLVSPPDLPGI